MVTLGCFFVLQVFLQIFLKSFSSVFLGSCLFYFFFIIFLHFSPLSGRTNIFPFP